MSTVSTIELASTAVEELPLLETPAVAEPALGEQPLAAPPTRPAWIEIDLQHLRRNFELLNRDKPDRLQVLSVLKDEAYGHGALPVAQVALECGARFLGQSTLEEAMALRDHGIKAP